MKSFNVWLENTLHNKNLEKLTKILRRLNRGIEELKTSPPNEIDKEFVTNSMNEIFEIADEVRDLVGQIYKNFQSPARTQFMNTWVKITQTKKRVEQHLAGQNTYMARNSNHQDDIDYSKINQLRNSPDQYAIPKYVLQWKRDHGDIPHTVKANLKQLFDNLVVGAAHELSTAIQYIINDK